MSNSKNAGEAAHSQAEHWSRQVQRRADVEALTGHFEGFGLRIFKQSP
jgi:hypothetical protein